MKHSSSLGLLFFCCLALSKVSVILLFYCIIFIWLFYSYLLESCSFSNERQKGHEFGGEGTGEELGVVEAEEKCNQDLLHVKRTSFHKKKKNTFKE